MLEVQLLDTCVGIACAGTTTAQTCKAGRASRPLVDGPMLPPWSGEFPPPPGPSPTIPIGGRTIWANGWHTCANRRGPSLLLGPKQRRRDRRRHDEERQARRSGDAHQRPRRRRAGSIHDLRLRSRGESLVLGAERRGELGLGTPRSPPRCPSWSPASTTASRLLVARSTPARSTWTALCLAGAGTPTARWVSRSTRRPRARKARDPPRPVSSRRCSFPA